jgi:hypothetical protein
MKTELLKIAQDLEQGTINEHEAQPLLLGLLSISKRFSFAEIENILRKPKLASIRKNLKNILVEANGYHYNSKEDIYFIKKYAGKKAIVYEWCGDWWIAEDDNYPITEKCFELVD